MNHRQNILAILNYQPYDHMPVISFGYWDDTVTKWANEGHISHEEAADYIKNGDNHWGDKSIMQKLGFDFNWNSTFRPRMDLFPWFEEELLETKPNGNLIQREKQGLIVMVKPGTICVPSEIGTSLTDREAWETLYLPKLQWSPDRFNRQAAERLIDDSKREIPIGLHCGSLIGTMRNLLGVEGLSYLLVDDEDLFVEIATTLAGLTHRILEEVLKTGAKFDYAHYWEDICFKNGPLVNPKLFHDLIGPLYKRNDRLLRDHGINIVSLDCDGLIDSLIPTWLENGVNTMFPIEVGTWGASIAPWRAKYGRALRGVGGMDKNVFAADRAAMDKEIERLKCLIKLGGYIPCPDHRMPPEANFETVRYYCECMQQQ